MVLFLLSPAGAVEGALGAAAGWWAEKAAFSSGWQAVRGALLAGAALLLAAYYLYLLILKAARGWAGQARGAQLTLGASFFLYNTARRAQAAGAGQVQAIEVPGGARRRGARCTGGREGRAQPLPHHSEGRERCASGTRLV